MKKLLCAGFLLAATAGSADAQNVAFSCWRCQYYVWSQGFSVPKSCSVRLPASNPWCSCITGTGKDKTQHWGTIYNSCIKPR